ncbi:MAG: hypothetical protein IT384_02015 [Deltaproteobacteria bacterium]|nr:hypothetical protein [Deltaproteobacteria bacterium]
MVKSQLASLLTGALLLTSGCGQLSSSVRPGFALADRPLGETLFSEGPVILRRGDEYFLTWTQGSYPFYFFPSYGAMDGRLVFALSVTSSSGNVAGRRREMKIEGTDHLQALQHGGAYWWEAEPKPNGSFVRLTIVEQPKGRGGASQWSLGS